MLKFDRIILPLKVLLVLLFAGLLVAEVLSVPGEFMQMARGVRPGFAHIPWLMLGVFGYVTAFIYFTPEIRDPGIPIVLFGIGLATSVVLLLMVVMRALLGSAATLRTDMEAVI